MCRVVEREPFARLVHAHSAWNIQSLQLVAPLEVADTVVTAVARSVKHVAVIAVGSHVYVNHVAVIAVGLQAGVSQFFFLQSLQLVGMWLCSMLPSLQMVFACICESLQAKDEDN